MIVLKGKDIPTEAGKHLHTHRGVPLDQTKNPGKSVIKKKKKQVIQPRSDLKRLARRPADEGLACEELGTHSTGH